MNRALHWINFFGILALVALCATQWQVNRRLNLTAVDLQRTQLSQQAKIAAQTKRISDQSADLEEFRERVRLSEAALADARKKLRALQSDRDQLAGALQQWKDAFAQRDAVIKQAAVDVRKTMDERNDTIKKFNDLADKYNASVKAGAGASGK